MEVEGGAMRDRERGRGGECIVYSHLYLGVEVEREGGGAMGECIVFSHL